MLVDRTLCTAPKHMDVGVDFLPRFFLQYLLRFYLRGVAMDDRPIPLGMGHRTGDLDPVRGIVFVQSDRSIVVPRSNGIVAQSFG